ncbi:histidine phosphatase family protein [Streptomyces luteolus]|uniref:Histidine phosphatase family protein n=1 Tax=Streptomyces luteolus TaxID=3043615 RepID=A0ABT6SPR3_9ACTN|nr:histidine phosphatase family protein [Streptomyces sp. B-S-A12]MDI3417599.1 histidine phosphatase family protein [Streptomyces sp. B-S-A12]
MTDLILVRHGETIWHAENRYTGRSDIPLTPRGRTQADHLATWAKQANLEALWVSPLGRALKTAAPSASATGLEACVDARLRELDFGDAEGMTTAEMRAAFPEALAAFHRDPAGDHLPGGELPADAVRRAMECLDEIRAAHPNGRVLIVGHSTLNRLLLCHLTGVPLSEYRRRFPVVRNCAVTELRWDGSANVSLLQFNTPTETLTNFSEATLGGTREEYP